MGGAAAPNLSENFTQGPLLLLSAARKTTQNSHFFQLARLLLH
jgi:hypothetical protein